MRLEVEKRGKVTAYGGLALAHKLVNGLDLPGDIDREVELLKFHLPYHESDHLLTHVYNIFAGGRRCCASWHSRPIDADPPALL